MGALARDTGGTITGAGTLRSRASIGAVGSRTTALAGGSVGTTCFVVGSGAGGFGVSGSCENASTGAMSLTVGKGTGVSDTAASFEGASVGAVSLTVGRGAGVSDTAASFESA